MKNIFRLSLIAAIAAIMSFSFAKADTLSQVKKKGYVKCGVSTGLVGFSYTDSKGVWKGLDVDVCRAVAAAVLGDSTKVKFVPLTAKERFVALSSGEIDVLVRNTTWTQTRDTSLGLNFAGINYYDGQGFLVSTKSGINSAKELDGATVCIQAGTTTELNLADYFKEYGMKYKAITYDTSDQTVGGFEKGRCDLLTSDQSQLYALRSKLKNPSSAKVLLDVISKEPLGPVVAQGDDKWFNVVRWSMFALVEAEELGISSKNVKSKLKSNNPATKRFLGTEGKMGSNLGIDAKFAYNIVKQVGNYGEIFEANVGPKTPLKISRGLNALWKNGGLMYPMPFR